MSFGLSGYQAALTKASGAANFLSRVPPTTIPAASPNDALSLRATTERLLAPPPPEPISGRAPSSRFLDMAQNEDNRLSVPEAVVDLVEAQREAEANATSIRVADEMMGELLDMRV